jgi:hypothetical protein
VSQHRAGTQNNETGSRDDHRFEYEVTDLGQVVSEQPNAQH